MTPEEFLIDEALLLPNEQAVRELFEPVKSNYSIDFDDPELGPPFRYYLLFELWPHLLDDGPTPLTPELCLYNKYYWFLRLKKLEFQRQGYDAGMEQQAFQLIEDSDADFDWSILESISNMVDAEQG